VPGNATIFEICQFFRQKAAFHAKNKNIFRGNFYIDDFSKFKSVNVEVLEDLEQYLNWILLSFKNRFLFGKKDSNIIEYIK
jgi:hypothetical protein